MILLPEGGTAPVGKVIAVIAEADEDVSSFTGAAEVVEPVVSSSAAEVVEPVDDPDQTSSPNSVEIQPVADGQRKNLADLFDDGQVVHRVENGAVILVGQVQHAHDVFSRQEGNADTG